MQQCSRIAKMCGQICIFFCHVNASCKDTHTKIRVQYAEIAPLRACISAYPQTILLYAGEIISQWDHD
jgi:hypothetical protein